jgi:hypothetical protein
MRENNYKHPHPCIIVSIRIRSIKHISIEKKRAVVGELQRRTNVQKLGLIYEALIQIHGVMMLSVYTC